MKKGFQSLLQWICFTSFVNENIYLHGGGDYDLTHNDNGRSGNDLSLRRREDGVREERRLSERGAPLQSSASGWLRGGGWPGRPGGGREQGKRCRSERGLRN